MFDCVVFASLPIRLWQSGEALQCLLALDEPTSTDLSLPGMPEIARKMQEAAWIL